MVDRPARPRRSSWAGGSTISSPEDVRRVLTQVNDAGLSRDNTALAPQLVRPADEVGLTEADITRVLPVHPALAGLLPWPGGIRRGATVAVVDCTSLVMALLAGAMNLGTAWGAVVGMPAFGAVAAAEAGVPLDRLALVPEPGPDWPTVVAAAIDGVEVVVVANPPDVAEPVIRALMNRARQKNTVLIPLTPWTGCDLVITRADRRWTGLGNGHGRLRSQQITLTATGRGRAVRPSTVTVKIPGDAGVSGLMPGSPPAGPTPMASPPGGAWAVEPNEAPATRGRWSRSLLDHIHKPQVAHAAPLHDRATGRIARRPTTVSPGSWPEPGGTLDPLVEH
jgi:hypothetical protein